MNIGVQKLRTDQKTYLQSLSNDPDKRTKEHETIVQYLCGKEQLEKLAALYGYKVKEPPVPKVSEPLRKYFFRGSGQESYIVGFMDLFLKYKTQILIEETGNFYEKDKYLVIEVKSKAGPISNWIQQINSYFETLCAFRGYRSEDTGWIVACGERIKKNEVEMLEKHGIDYIYVCPKKATEWLENYNKS